MENGKISSILPNTIEEYKKGRPEESPSLSAGILFYGAGGTAAMEDRIHAMLLRIGGTLSGALAIQEEKELLRMLNHLLESSRCVFVVSGASGGRPEAAEPIFRAMRASLTPEGEPETILTLSGKQLRGYLPESREKIICILPDEEEEAQGMLKEAFLRIAEKFSLPYEEEKDAALDSEKERKGLQAFFHHKEGNIPAEKLK